MEFTQDDSVTTRELDSLFSFLTDTKNQESRKVIISRLLDLIPFGHHPMLHIESLSDPALRMVLREKYLKNLNEWKMLFDLKKALRRNQGELDLETGAFLVSRFSSRTVITPEDFSKKLDEMAGPLIERLIPFDSTEQEMRLEILRQYLFEDLQFRGNSENYYDPENSYITSVLETRLGIPVSLSVLVLLIGKRVDIPLSGVNLPGHFLVRLGNGSGHRLFMDPYNSGNILTEDECFHFLTWQGLEPSPGYLTGSGSMAIIKRMYRNLINFYSSDGNNRIEKNLRQQFSLLHESYTRS